MGYVPRESSMVRQLVPGQLPADSCQMLLFPFSSSYPPAGLESVPQARSASSFVVWLLFSFFSILHFIGSPLTLCPVLFRTVASSLEWPMPSIQTPLP